MVQQLHDGDIVLNPNKPSPDKRRKPTVAQILKEAYLRHCKDRATRVAVKQCLKR